MKRSHLLNQGFVYVLSLEKGYFYVGETAHLKKRLSQHVCGLYYNSKKDKWSSGGAVVTRSLKPQRLVGLYRPDVSYAHFREMVNDSVDLPTLEGCMKKAREKEEVALTKHYMELYGRQWVKGAHWCSLERTPKGDLLSTLKDRRPLCKCSIPAERKVTYSGKVKWVCGIQLIQDLVQDLFPSEKGLMMPLTDSMSIPVGVSCDLEKTPEIKRRLQPVQD